jgi:hypothetical protein
LTTFNEYFTNRDDVDQKAEFKVTAFENSIRKSNQLANFESGVH